MASAQKRVWKRDEIKGQEVYLTIFMSFLLRNEYRPEKSGQSPGGAALGPGTSLLQATLPINQLINSKGNLSLLLTELLGLVYPKQIYAPQ